MNKVLNKVFRFREAKGPVGEYFFKDGTSVPVGRVSAIIISVGFSV